MNTLRILASALTLIALGACSTSPPQDGLDLSAVELAEAVPAMERRPMTAGCEMGMSKFCVSALGTAADDHTCTCMSPYDIMNNIRPLMNQ